MPRYVEWLGYLGGSGDDIGYGVGTDAAGNVYVAGSTSSFDLGAAAGWSEEIPIEGASDIFVAKLSPDGRELLALATLIGPGTDAALALRVAPDGGIVVGGNVQGGFPAAEHDCGREVAGPQDAFVARYSPDLDLEALQLVGGSGDEGLRDLHVAPDGTIAITGHTTSHDMLAGWDRIALQPTFRGGANDFFVVRLRLDATGDCSERILYQTYLGSSGDEADPEGAPFPGAIHASEGGTVTVSGSTTSWSTFPRMAGGYEAPARGGGDDTFVVRLLGDASVAAADQLLYTAILGGSSLDRSTWLEVDAAGRVLVGGATWTADYPRTDGSSFGGWNDSFVTLLDPSQAPEAQLLSSGLAGGEQWDLSTDGLWRADGKVVVAGSTGSSGFPRSLDALGIFAGGEVPQAFIYEWRPDEGLPRADRVIFASPLTTAGQCPDSLRCNRVLALAESPGGSVIACGAVSGSLLLVAGDPAQPEKSSGADVFVGSFDIRGPTAAIALDTTSGEAPLEVHATATVSTPAPTRIESESTAWSVVGPGGAVEYQGLELHHTFEVKGNYRVTFTVKNDRDRIATRSLIVRVQAPAAPRFVRGNTDGEGEIDISDAIGVLDYLFLGPATLPCLDAADADDTGGMELTDAVYILGFLFLGGPAPPAPHSGCGPDPTADELGCATLPEDCR